mgnify:CR=1 FL=1
MNLQIALFLVFGFCFGLLTYSNRHLFSEGPGRRPDPGEGESIGARLVWAMVCSTLRPILEALKIEHFAIQRQEDLEFVTDRMIKQAFATQAAATL